MVANTKGELLCFLSRHEKLNTYLRNLTRQLCEGICKAYAGQIVLKNMEPLLWIGCLKCQLGTTKW